MNENEHWQAVLERDKGQDGAFVYAVRSTGIYCRPSCPSRRPHREHVVFFTQPAVAEQAGFRPCRRCHPQTIVAPEPHLALVERICRALVEQETTPTLEELAATFHLSPYHLQRVFKRVVGVTPRQYADSQRVQRFKARLRDGDDVTPALYDAGYGSSSSVYEQSADQLGMTPGAYRRGGKTMTISYTLVPCSLGRLLVAATERGICAVRLGESDAALEATLRAEFPAATVARDDAALGEVVATLLRHLAGEQPHLDLPLDIQATAFQRQVWEALRAIPYGATRSYGAVAATIGRPTAVRAVARACATNPVALVVPCHRVVREDGSMGGYRWGIERKEALLQGEQQA